MEKIKNEIVKNESVENVESTAKSVVVSSQTGASVEARNPHFEYTNNLKRYHMYYGRRNGTLCKDRLCIITNFENSRGKLMVTWIELERVDNEYNRETGETTYWIFTAKKYRKSAKNIVWKGYEQYASLEVFGPHGVSPTDEVTVEDLEKNVYFKDKTIVVRDECVDYGYIEGNSTLNPAGFKFMKVSEKKAEETKHKEDVEVVMNAYAIESGYEDNDTQNAIDYFTNKMNEADEEADVALTRKLIYLRGNGMANDPERLKELNNDTSVAIGRYFMYKKYVDILTNTNEFQNGKF